MSDEEKELIEETNKSAEDEHEEHDVSLFIKIFAWLVFYTLIEVGAILQEFSFWTTMFILFSIAFVKVWYIAAYFMHLKWDPPLAKHTSVVPVLFLAIMFLGIGLTNPGAVDDFRSLCGF
tara:strand:+ start:140 stop:499 length:360 start_codon:yes stop_codon:yes gene_type:complete